MNLNDKIYIAGHNGLVGSAIFRLLQKQGFNNILTRSRDELNLTNQKQVNNFFKKKTGLCNTCSRQSWRHSCKQYISS